MFTVAFKLTVGTDGNVEPVVGCDGGCTSRAAPPGRLVAICTGVPRRLIVNVLDGFLPVAKGAHLGLPDYDHSKIDHPLDA